MSETTDSRRKVFAPGAQIFTEGQPGTQAYVVEYGRVAVYKTVLDRRVDLGVIVRGGIFGEMALIDDQPRMASAMAMEETACVVIGKERLQQQLQMAPDNVRVIVGGLLSNIRAMGTELAEAQVRLACGPVGEDKSA
jgi:CRP/FNR family transcriptional regulator, cyclic AMP receptor protein